MRILRLIFFIIVGAFALLGFASVVHIVLNPTTTSPVSPPREAISSSAEPDLPSEASGQVPKNTLGLNPPSLTEKVGREEEATEVASALLEAEPSEVTRISSKELGVETHKWEGRIIETRLNCFYADVNEFRCVAAVGRGRVDFSHLEPADLRRKIEKNCDTVEKSNKSSCFFTVRFTYKDFHRMDVGGMFGHLTVVEAKDGIGAVIQSKRKNR